MQTRSQTRAAANNEQKQTKSANLKLSIKKQANEDVSQELADLRAQNNQLKNCLAEIVGLLVENKNAISKSL